MYKPREDSFLLLKHIKDYINKENIILEVGTGSGILAQEATKYAIKVVACDIDKQLIKKLKEKSKDKKIHFIHSDLFSNIDGKFDLIIFNPPYLLSGKIKYRDIDGGKKGIEVIEKFLVGAKNYLEKKGKILLLCSSLNKNVENLFKKYNYKFKKIDKQNLFFEKLFVYELNLIRVKSKLDY
jgi:release factor glutamine methyltransferase